VTGIEPKKELDKKSPLRLEVDVRIHPAREVSLTTTVAPSLQFPGFRSMNWCQSLPDMSKRTHPPYCVSFEGPIGAGKTVLIEQFVDYLRRKGLTVAVIPEPVEEWAEIMKRYNKDIKRWALHFQIEAFTGRVRKAQEVYMKHAATVDVFVSERSFASDTVFMKLLRDDGSVDELEYTAYMKWWSMFAAVVPIVPNLFLYLRPNVSICMDRLRNRNRPGESGITSDYQIRLMNAHDALFGYQGGEWDASKNTEHIGHATLSPVLQPVPCVTFMGTPTHDNFRDNTGCADVLSESMFAHMKSNGFQLKV